MIVFSPDSRIGAESLKAKVRKYIVLSKQLDVMLKEAWERKTSAKYIQIP